MYNHNKAQQSKNRVHISWDIPYDFNICVDGLERESSNSSALAVEYLQSAPSHQYLGSRGITFERLEWFTSLVNQFYITFHVIYFVHKINWSFKLYYHTMRYVAYIRFNLMWPDDTDALSEIFVDTKLT